MFRDDPEDWQRLDLHLLLSGSIHLYYRPSVLAKDFAWLRSHGYRIESFDCSKWTTEEAMHEELASRLDFPAYYGRDLNALNDCIGDIEIPEESGMALLFYRYDSFAAEHPTVAWTVLDIIEIQSRRLLLFGKRLLTLLQSDDPTISFDRVDALSVTWNRSKWLSKSRGI